MKLAWRALQPTSPEVVKQTRVKDIIARTMQWHGKSTS